MGLLWELASLHVTRVLPADWWAVCILLLRDVIYKRPSTFMGKSWFNGRQGSFVT